MNFWSRVTLQWRIMGGFLLCAAITGVSVTAGIFSLHQIQSNMSATTRSIEINIDNQNVRLRQLMPLRALVTAIGRAKDDAALAKAESELAELADTTGTVSGVSLEPIVSPLQNLAKIKERQLLAQGRLAELRRRNVNSLKDVNGLITKVAEEAEFAATRQIDRSITEIRNNFGEMTSTTEMAFSVIMTAMEVRSYYREIVNVGEGTEIPDGLAAGLIDYAETAIDDLIRETRQEVRFHRDSEFKGTVVEGMERVASRVTALVAAKRKQMAADPATADAVLSDRMVGLRRGLEAELASLTEAALARVDGTVMAATIEVNDVLSTSTNTALSTIQSAMALRSDSNELNILIKDVLLAREISAVKAAESKAETLLKNAAENRLLELADSEDALWLSRKLTDLAGLIREMFAAVKEMMQADGELAYSVDRIYNSLGALDRQIIQSATLMKRTANTALSESAAMVGARQVFLICIGGVAVLLAVIIGVITWRSARSTIERITDGMIRSMQEVAHAATCFSEDNRRLVVGAETQDGSLQHTAGIVERLLGSTQHTAARAHQVRTIMQTASERVERTAGSMDALSDAIQAIADANREIEQITHTVETIAFQTNLLALNAAVEAARAGESGAGFAVVADEVRRLALQASQAAQDTGELILKITHQISEQQSLMDTNIAHFSEASRHITAVGEEVRAIIAAFEEQADGVQAINDATAEMSDVVARNLESAQQSVVTYQNLEEQTNTMLSYIRILKGLEEQHLIQKFYRLPIVVPGQIRVEGRRIDFNTKNFSKGGALIRTEAPLTVGMKGVAKFRFDRWRLPPIRFRVVRQGLDSNADAAGYYAIMFLKPKAKARRVLNRIVQSFWNARFDSAPLTASASAGEE